RRQPARVELTVDGRRVRSAQSRDDFERLSDGQRGRKDGSLRQVADARAGSNRITREVDSSDDDAPCVRPGKPDDQTQCCVLAGPVPADERDALSGLDFEIEAIENLAIPKRFRQTRYLEHGPVPRNMTTASAIHPASSDPPASGCARPFAGE